MARRQKDFPENVTVPVKPEMKSDLKQIADDEQTAVATIARQILRDGIDRRKAQRRRAPAA